MHWEEKAVKSEVSPEVEQNRLTFCRKNEKKTSEKWLQKVQAVGDFKDFTWYPPNMQRRAKRYATKYTYLRPGEKHKRGLTRPKDGRWFSRQEFKKAKKVNARARSL